VSLGHSWIWKVDGRFCYFLLIVIVTVEAVLVSLCFILDYLYRVKPCTSSTFLNDIRNTCSVKPYGHFSSLSIKEEELHFGRGSGTSHLGFFMYSSSAHREGPELLLA
jgi:hypothetical protein